MKNFKKYIIGLLVVIVVGFVVQHADAQVCGVVGSDGSAAVGWGGVCDSGGGGGGWSLAGASAYGLPSGSISGIITNLLKWLLMIMGIIGVIAFVIAGLLYLTSAGDEGQIDRAKTAMTWAIVGIIVGLSGLIVMQAVANLLSGSTTF